MSYQKANPIRSLSTRCVWRFSRNFCYACGDSLALQLHHICKFRRSDEPCNFMLLDVWCHQSAEGLSVVRFGAVQPVLTLGAQLWLKRAIDPAEYNPERLTVLYGQTLPEIEEPPLYYLRWLKQRKVLRG